MSAKVIDLFSKREIIPPGDSISAEGELILHMENLAGPVLTPFLLAVFPDIIETLNQVVKELNE